MPGPLGIGGGGGGSGGTVTTSVFPFIDRAVAQTIGNTGVQSLTAGTGISVSGTTTPTITNSGVTSIVAGTGITVSGATGSVTVSSASDVLLAKVSVAAPNTSVLTVSNIPQTYSHIIIRASNIQTTSTTAFNENIYVRLNGDAGNSYRDNTSALKSYFTAFNAPTSFNFGGYYKGFCSLWVPSYTAAIYKLSSQILYSTSYADSVSYNQYVSSTQLALPQMWLSTAAVTSVSITAITTAFVSGTTLSVYGIA